MSTVHNLHINTLVKTMHSKEIIGSYLYSDMSISPLLADRQRALGLIFDTDAGGGVWIMALADTPCAGAHSPADLTASVRATAAGCGGIEWQVAGARHWMRLLVNVCGCALDEIVDGFGSRVIGYSFDAARATARLSPVGIDLGAGGCCYWTSTVESDGSASIVGYGEIREDPMPYTDADLAEGVMRLRLVALVNGLPCL